MRNSSLKRLATQYQNAPEKYKYLYLGQIEFALKDTKASIRDKQNYIYGAPELKIRFSEKGFDDFFKDAIKKVLNNFDAELVRNSSSVERFFTKSLSGMLKDEICRMNSVSKRYVNLLIALKKANLNIWNDKDLSTIKFFLSDDSKNPMDLVIKMRQAFTVNMPAGTKRQLTSKQLRDYVANTLHVSKKYAEIAINLYRDQVNIWNDSAVGYMSFGLGYKRPEAALTRLRNVFNQEEFTYMVSYLNYCDIPDAKSNVIDFNGTYEDVKQFA